MYVPSYSLHSVHYCTHNTRVRYIYKCTEYTFRNVRIQRNTKTTTFSLHGRCHRGCATMNARALVFHARTAPPILGKPGRWVSPACRTSVAIPFTFVRSFAHSSALRPGAWLPVWSAKLNSNTLYIDKSIRAVIKPVTFSLLTSMITSKTVIRLWRRGEYADKFCSLKCNSFRYNLLLS